MSSCGPATTKHLRVEVTVVFVASYTKHDAQY